MNREKNEGTKNQKDWTCEKFERGRAESLRTSLNNYLLSTSDVVILEFKMERKSI